MAIVHDRLFTVVTMDISLMTSLFRLLIIGGTVIGLGFTSYANSENGKWGRLCEGI